MTPEEVWQKACAVYEDAVEEHPEMPLRDMVIAGDKAAVSVIRTAMEAYAAEKVAEALAADPTEAMEYNIGDKVVKPRGYPFPGTVVAAFLVAGGQRYVVESELAPGMLHIFSPSQLAHATNQHTEVTMLTPEQIADGWIEHDGGPCPVPLDSRPIYMMRDGTIDAGQRGKASELIWDDSCSPEDQIIAYRPEPRHD